MPQRKKKQEVHEHEDKPEAGLQEPGDLRSNVPLPTEDERGVHENACVKAEWEQEGSPMQLVNRGDQQVADGKQE